MKNTVKALFTTGLFVSQLLICNPAIAAAPTEMMITNATVNLDASIKTIVLTGSGFTSNGADTVDLTKMWLYDPYVEIDNFVFSDSVAVINAESKITITLGPIDTLALKNLVGGQYSGFKTETGWLVSGWEASTDDDLYDIPLIVKNDPPIGVQIIEGEYRVSDATLELFCSYDPDFSVGLESGGSIDITKFEIKDDDILKSGQALSYTLREGDANITMMEPQRIQWQLTPQGIANLKAAIPNLSDGIADGSVTISASTGWYLDWTGKASVGPPDNNNFISVFPGVQLANDSNNFLYYRTQGSDVFGFTLTGLVPNLSNLRVKFGWVDNDGSFHSSNAIKEGYISVTSAQGGTYTFTTPIANYNNNEGKPLAIQLYSGTVPIEEPIVLTTSAEEPVYVNYLPDGQLPPPVIPGNEGQEPGPGTESGTNPGQETNSGTNPGQGTGGSVQPDPNVKQIGTPGTIISLPTTSGISPNNGLPIQEINLAKSIKITDQVLSNQKVITVLVDEVKASATLVYQPNSKLVVIPVKESGDRFVLRLSANLINSLSARNAYLKFDTPLGMSLLPVREFKLNQLAKQLATKEQDLTVDIIISKVTTDRKAAVSSAANKAGVKILSTPVFYKVEVSTGSKRIELRKFSTYAAFIIPIDSLANAKLITGIALDSKGVLAPLPTQFTQINGQKFAVVKSKAPTMFTVVSGKTPRTFSDIKTHPAKDAITSLADKLILAGTTNQTFTPNGQVTRAQFATIIVRALGLEGTTGKAKFKDVKEKDWYAPAISTAVEAGIIQGYRDGKFKPMAPVTKEEAAAMLDKALQVAGVRIDVTPAEVDNYLKRYADKTKVSPWARSVIAKTIKAGIVSGNSQGMMDPRKNSTRAEVAVMVKRMMEKAGFI